MTTQFLSSLFLVGLSLAAGVRSAADDVPTPCAAPHPAAVDVAQPSDDADWPPPGVPDDLDPIYFFETQCPNDLILVNWTKCTLYFRTFLDCDGDGIVDTWQEHFVAPIDEATGVPWVEHIETEEDCEILYWGLFDILPWGGCWPDWVQDPDFPCAVHFL